MIFIVRNPIGRYKEYINRSFMLISSFSVRLVSDIVHYNSTLKHKSFYRPVLDIDQLIMGRDPDGDRPYDAHLGISKRKFSQHIILM